MLFICSSNISAQTCAADPGFVPTTTVAPSTVSSFYGAAATFPTLMIHITGTFFVDNAFTIASGSIVKIDDNVQIIVQSGNTLTINNGTLSNCDNSMWGRITVKPGAKVIVKSNSLIENGYTAVYSEGSGAGFGDYQIQDSRLLNNYIGIGVESTTSTHTGLVKNTEIGAPILIAPHSGKHGYKGIDIDGVLSGITIGNTAGSITMTGDNNYIHDYEYGIFASESRLYVQNNVFENLTKNDSTLLDLGIGVASEGNTSSSSEVYVGYPDAGVTGTNNLFTDCNYGVIAFRSAAADIENNRFTGSLPPGGPTMKNAVQLRNVSGKSEVLNNEISEFRNHGILVRDSRGVVEVADNMIYNILIDANPDNTVMAVQVRDFLVNNMVTVSGNDIDHVQRGVDLLNVPSASVVSNDIDFFLPSGSSLPAWGIHAQGSDIPTIMNNVIHGNCPSCMQAIELNARGIEMETSPGFNVDGNDVFECSIGIQAFGSNTAGNFTCNKIDDCATGFGLKDIPSVPPSFTSIQLGPITASPGFAWAAGNRWFPTTTANRTHAYSAPLGIGTKANLLEWYYNGTLGAEHDMPLALNTNSGTPSSSVLPSSSSYTPCGFLLSPPPGSSESVVFSSSTLLSFIAALSPSVDECDNYAQRRYVYDYFTKNPADLIGDATLNKLYVRATSNAFLSFSAIDTAMAYGDWITAKSLNSSVVAECQRDSLLQEVIGIYLSGVDSSLGLAQVISGVLPYSAADITRLEQIAGMSGLNDNPAVYRARALVDHVNMSDTSLRMQETHNPGSENAFEQLIKVYPQPASELMTLIIPESLKGIIKAELFDLTGNVVRSLNNSAGALSMQISVQNLSPGMYVVRLTDNKGVSISRTITVQ